MEERFQSSRVESRVTSCRATATPQVRNKDELYRIGRVVVLRNNKILDIFKVEQTEVLNSTGMRYKRKKSSMFPKPLSEQMEEWSRHYLTYKR